MALSNEQWNAPSGGGNFYEYQIANSLRGSAAGDTTLKFTAGTPTSTDVMTMSCWVKRHTPNSTNAAANNIFTTGTGGGAYFYMALSAGLDIENTGGNAGAGYLLTTEKFRDGAAWYHIILRVDTSQSTAFDRIRVYVNGQQLGLNSESGGSAAWRNQTMIANTAEDEDFSFLNADGLVQAIGGLSGKGHGTEGADLSIADFMFFDGQSFYDELGEYKNGVWIPKDPSGLTFGNNGYWLRFLDSSAIGEDSSGNGNDFAVANFTAHDVLGDSPTFGGTNGGNFCTLNPLYSGTAIAGDANKLGVLSEGNLKHAFSNNQDASCPGTIKTPPSGKWYFEYAIIAGGGTGDYSPGAGIIDPEVYTNNTPGYEAVGSIQYANNLNKVYKGTSVVGTYSGSRGSNGDVMGIAVDMDNGAFYVSKNGTYQTINGGAVGDPTSGASKTGAGATWTPASEFTNGMVPLSAPNGGSVPIINLNFGQDGTFQGTETAGGNADANDFGNFFTAPPTDYLAVCTGNLTAAADPAEEEQPSKFFQALAYTGNGQNGHDLTTVMKADSVWGKNRTTSAGTATRWFNQTAHNFGTGAEEYVQFDQASYGGTTSQAQGYSGATATNLTVGNNGYTNVNNSSYINYLQGSNGASVVNDTSGDIDVARFATANQGMSVMYYTGTGTSGHTVPHGLGVKPDFIIIKNSTSQNSSAWRVYAKAFGDSNDYAVMNTDAAWQESGGIFTADPTTSVMALADDVTVNNGSNNYMAWAYANAEGMVKAGKYYGNANDDGVFVYTGFRPAMFMCKPIVQGNWRMFDTTRSFYNVAANTLFPNSNAPQQTNDSNLVDILSNGVKMRASDSNYNQATTFHYLAFAENPFKYETAR